MKSRIAVCCLALTSLLGCKRDKAAPETSALPGASASAPASAKPAAPEPPWYVGRWLGTYESRHYEMKMTRQEGAVREWADDPGTEGQGKGSIDFDVDADGRATGKAGGPLGDMVVTGMVDESAVTLDLKSIVSDPAKQFNGFIVAKRSEHGLTGTLQASNGTGLLVRDGTVELSKKPPGP